MGKTYDSKCYDLAETFLADEGTLSTDRADQLASEIQHTIEEWLDANRPRSSANRR